MNTGEKKRKLLITGGAGFIGTNLIFDLMADGEREIIVIDNESPGNPDQILDCDIEYIRGDITDEYLVRSVLKDVDEVVHLAADTRVIESIEDPSKNFDINVRGTFGLLKAARDAGVKRFINASTGGAILGDRTPPINEEMAAQPISPYGAAKLAVEGYCSAFQGAYGLGTVSLRFSNIYGPRSFHKGSVVAHFFRSIINGQPLTVYGDGTQQRDYLFVSDLTKGIRLALDSEKTGVFQLGSGIPTSINVLLDHMRTITGGFHELEVRHEDFRDGEVRDTWCDVTKAKDDLGFIAPTALDVGLRDTWNWFLSA
ncbi:MAG: NAD-dependent epimerase/dehydratase family protein [Rhodospirillaceae bacterium]|nr:NAD-dependent epimerase/dehydratase family protein [Rhodospirillaceae bacterium]MBT3908767.1 NAD-dependent epimerase/dehydratase family protein [Rhodospirillaceae bacterium]